MFKKISLSLILILGIYNSYAFEKSLTYFQNNVSANSVRKNTNIKVLNDSGSFEKIKDSNFYLSLNISSKMFQKDSNKYLTLTRSSNNNNWLGINPIINNSNSFKIKETINAGQKSQFREVNSQSGFGGQSSYTQHFGMYNVMTIDNLVVR